jgi:hypothetical protein
MDKTEFEEMLKTYLKENMSIDVFTNDEYGDFGYGDYKAYKSHTVTVSIAGEEICKTQFATG